MKGLQRPSELIAQGRVYFQCGEELTTRRDLELTTSFVANCSDATPSPRLKIIFTIVHTPRQ